MGPKCVVHEGRGKLQPTLAPFQETDQAETGKQQRQCPQRKQAVKQPDRVQPLFRGGWSWGVGGIWEVRRCWKQLRHSRSIRVNNTLLHCHSLDYDNNSSPLFLLWWSQYHQPTLFNFCEHLTFVLNKSSEERSLWQFSQTTSPGPFIYIFSSVLMKPFSLYSFRTWKECYCSKNCPKTDSSWMAVGTPARGFLMLYLCSLS